MRCVRRFVLGLGLAGLLLARPALADHMAIVYCAVDEKNDVRVVAADANPTGEAWTGARRGQSCSQALHEIMSLGYEVTHINVPNGVGTAATQRGERGYIVFVLKKTAPHK